MSLWQLNSIAIEEQYLCFGYTDRQRAEQLVRKSKKHLRLVDESNLYSTIPNGMTDPDELIAHIRSLLALG